MFKRQNVVDVETKIRIVVLVNLAIFAATSSALANELTQ
jgi:hypothetical protein